ncbi:YggT family protein [Clostridium lundense]|uniref:YggT family protein n=1 Tax=Clostridium lundense TaxID=319475 RepID=UPI0005562C30|nr:YggT family protein [Clostridium lundense]
MNYTLIRIINICFSIAEWAILIDVLLSYVPMGRENSVTQLVHAITEPLLAPGRKIQERIIPGLMIDFSPVFALLILYVLKRIVYSIIAGSFMI